MDTYYYSTAVYQFNQTAFNVSPIMPYFLVESNYEDGNNVGLQQLRAQMYWTMLSGGFGHVFGNCPVWNLGAAPSYCSVAVTGWKTALDKPGAVGMSYAKNLFGARAWQNLVPDFNHTFLTAGYGTSGQSNYVTATLSPDGSLALAYLPSIRGVTVDLSKMRGVTRAQWFDPSNGAYTNIGTFSNQGSQVFTPLSNNSSGDGDWVLVLTAP